MQLGPWTIEAEVGRGASGVVHRARGPDGRLAAVKLLPRPTDPARFERELRIASELGEAEGFVPVVGSGSSADCVWVAMPYLGGGTLRARIARGPLPIDQALAIARALAGSLAAAHERGIVHRDVKPENVLFDEQGRPFLADLGTAKHYQRASDASRDLSNTGEVRGTPIYLPPEQAQDATRVTPAADVYALGLTLHECLSGKPPFRAVTLIELLAAKAQGRHVPLREARGDVPAWICAVVDTALEPDPLRRFPDGSALATALQGEPPSRRAPILVAALLALLALGLGAGVIAAIPRGSAPQAAANAPAIDPLADEVALLARDDVEPAARRVAFGRVVEAASGAALDSAVAASPRAAWLRRARLERARTGPLRVEDLQLAAGLFARGELAPLGERALALGLDAPLDPGSLPPDWSAAPEAALLLSLARLTSGRRGEAVQALERARPGPASDALREALLAVDAFDHGYAAPEVDAAGLVARGARVSKALVALPAAQGLAELVLAPLTRHMRRVALEKNPLDGLRGPQAAFEAACLPAHHSLPPHALIAFEVISYDARNAKRKFPEAQAEMIALELQPRLSAACAALRETDPELAGRAEVILIGLELRFHPDDPAWEEPILAHTRELAARSTGMVRMRALDLGITALWYAGRRRLARGSEAGMVRCLDATAHGIETARAVGDLGWVGNFEERRWLVLLLLGRLDQLERELAGASRRSPEWALELRRRQGDARGAVDEAHRLLADPQLPTWTRLRLWVTRALALATLGDADGAKAQLADVEEWKGEDDGEAVGYEQTLGQLREAVAGQAR